MSPISGRSKSWRRWPASATSSSRWDRPIPARPSPRRPIRELTKSSPHRTWHGGSALRSASGASQQSAHGTLAVGVRDGRSRGRTRLRLEQTKVRDRSRWPEYRCQPVHRGRLAFARADFLDRGELAIMVAEVEDTSVDFLAAPKDGSLTDGQRARGGLTRHVHSRCTEQRPKRAHSRAHRLPAQDDIVIRSGPNFACASLGLRAIG